MNEEKIDNIREQLESVNDNLDPDKCDGFVEPDKPKTFPMTIDVRGVDLSDGSGKVELSNIQPDAKLHDLYEGVKDTEIPINVAFWIGEIIKKSDTLKQNNKDLAATIVGLTKQVEKAEAENDKHNKLYRDIGRKAGPMIPDKLEFLNIKNDNLEAINAELLAACKLAYRKHHLNDDSIGWEELSHSLLDVICNTIGNDNYCKWLRGIIKPSKPESGVPK